MQRRFIQAGNFPAALAAIERAISLYEGLESSGQLAATMEADFAEVLGLEDYCLRTSNPNAACAAFRRAFGIIDAANRRQPLTALRQKTLEFFRDELTKCR
jgi:hypothetical protein